MNNENSVPIADLFELNKRVCLNLWHMANEHGKPSNLSPHVIYPLNRDRTPRIRDRTPRISEQEARVICCGLLNNLSLYYSVETPTEQRYVQKGKKKEGMAAQTDLTMYNFDGQSLKRVINMEFKAHNCDKRDVGKDIKKLVREGYQGNWFHILANYDAGTFPALFSKFKYAFTKYPKPLSHENFSSKTISIIFCFCVLQKQKAYMRHFSYEPSQNDHSEYVTSFFEASNLDKHWYKFKKNDFENKVEPKISIPPEITKNRISYEEFLELCGDCGHALQKALHKKYSKELRLLYGVKTMTVNLSSPNNCILRISNKFSERGEKICEFSEQLENIFVRNKIPVGNGKVSIPVEKDERFIRLILQSISEYLGQVEDKK